MSFSKDLPWWLQLLVSLPEVSWPYKATMTLLACGFVAWLWASEFYKPEPSKDAAQGSAPARAPSDTTVMPTKNGGALAWDDHWGTTTMRASGTIYLSALQIRARNVSDHTLHLGDAYVTSGKTGEIARMRVDAGSDGWLPPDKLNAIPPGATISYMVEFSPPQGMSATDFMLNWGIIMLTVRYDDQVYTRKFSEAEMSRIFEAFGVSPLGPRATKRRDEEKL